MNAPIIVFSWIKMTAYKVKYILYPFIRPNFVPKSDTVQLLICSTPRQMPRLFQLEIH